MRKSIICAMVLAGALMLGLTGCGYNEVIEGAGGDYYDEPIEDVIADKDGVKVVISEYNAEGNRYRVKMNVQNNSSEGLLFTIEDASINGLMFNTTWKEYVPAGGSKSSYARWNREQLAEYGIDSIEELSFTLVGTNNAGKRVIEVEACQYPNGNKKSYDYNCSEDGVSVFNTDGLSFKVLKLERMGYLGYTLSVYMKNDSDKDVTYNFNTALTGDNVNKAIWSCNVKAGTAAYGTIKWAYDRFPSIEKIADDELIFPIEIVDENGNMLMSEIISTKIPAEMIPTH